MLGRHILAVEVILSEAPCSEFQEIYSQGGKRITNWHQQQPGKTENGNSQLQHGNGSSCSLLGTWVMGYPFLILLNIHT